MLRKSLRICIPIFGLVALMATPAKANTLTSATATANCQGYILTVNATDLTVNVTYTIDYSFIVTCGGGAPITITNSTTFTATDSTETVTASGSFNGNATGGNCTVTGTATLTSSGSTVDITINGTGTATLSCPSTLTLACYASTGAVGVPYNSSLVASGGVPPYFFSGSGPSPGGLSLNTTTGAITGTPLSAGTFIDSWTVVDSSSPPNTAQATCPLTISPVLPTACVLPPSGTAINGAPVSWNGFTPPAGSVVWINAHLDAKNVPTNTITTVDFTGVSLVVNATTYALPNGQVVFSPATSTPTTVVNPDGSWTTTVNPSFNNDIFFDGQAIPVDANLENGGHGNTGSTLSFSTNSSDSTLQFQWQWSAAVYTSWPGNAAANIVPVHAQLQAGAPLNKTVEADLIQGPRGGGGSNFTGSWSGTGQGNCP